MRKLVTALFFFLAALQAQAAPATAESIERLLVASNVEATMDSFYVAMEQIMRQSMQQAVGQQRLTPEQQRVMDSLPPKFMKLMKDEYGWASMKPDFVRIYQETFEQEEVEAMIAFYQSPAGRSLLAKMPLIIQRSAALSQQRMVTLMPRMTRMLEDAIREAAQAR
ncbi:DUF2059 domain-containing protein [Ramlibacter sp. PS4R-6]|uniref:DUF2059 domain-containing protein n=1 Tax=Ramlibacter sp. PS4R-6 TaxID=3133438 RepID=UPI00309DB742